MCFISHSSGKQTVTTFLVSGIQGVTHDISALHRHMTKAHIMKDDFYLALFFRSEIPNDFLNIGRASVHGLNYSKAVKFAHTSIWNAEKQEKKVEKNVRWY